LAVLREKIFQRFADAMRGERRPEKLLRGGRVKRETGYVPRDAASIADMPCTEVRGQMKEDVGRPRAPIYWIASGKVLPESFRVIVRWIEPVRAELLDEGEQFFCIAAWPDRL
jgi:hypothetical protein